MITIVSNDGRKIQVLYLCFLGYDFKMISSKFLNIIEHSFIHPAMRYLVVYEKERNIGWFGMICIILQSVILFLITYWIFRVWHWNCVIFELAVSVYVHTRKNVRLFCACLPLYMWQEFRNKWFPHPTRPVIKSFTVEEDRAKYWYWDGRNSQWIGIQSWYGTRFWGDRDQIKAVLSDPDRDMIEK